MSLYPLSIHSWCHNIAIVCIRSTTVVRTAYSQLTIRKEELLYFLPLLASCIWLLTLYMNILRLTKENFSSSYMKLFVRNYNGMKSGDFFILPQSVIVNVCGELREILLNIQM